MFQMWNWVECKKVDTLTKKATRKAMRKGSITVASTTIGSIIPDVETLVWVDAGFIADILMNDYLNEQVKKARIRNTIIMKKLLII